MQSGSEDCTIRLWSTDSPISQRLFVGHTASVTVVAFHPNGNYIASGSDDTSIRIWSVDTGNIVRLFHPHNSIVRSLAFSPNGSVLAIGYDDSTLVVLHLETTQILWKISGNTSYSLSVLPQEIVQNIQSVLSSNCTSMLFFNVYIYMQLQIHFFFFFLQVYVHSVQMGLLILIQLHLLALLMMDNIFALVLLIQLLKCGMFIHLHILGELQILLNDLYIKLMILYLLSPLIVKFQKTIY